MKELSTGNYIILFVILFVISLFFIGPIPSLLLSIYVTVIKYVCDLHLPYAYKFIDKIIDKILNKNKTEKNE